MSLVHSNEPAFRHLLHRLSDPDEFGVALSGASLAADFLAPQARPTRVEQFQAPGWTLDFHEAHVQARVQGPLPPGWASLGFMRGQARSSWSGFPAQQGVLMLNPPGEGLDGFITPGFASMAINVPRAVWEQCQALAGVDRPAFCGVTPFHLSAPLCARIERKLRTTRRMLRAATTPRLARFAALEAADFAASMFTMLWELSASANPPRDSLRNRARLARRAEAWMREHLASPVRIPDVCFALRVSRRELEYAFRTVFNQSPRDFLHSLRLNAVRRALRRLETPVIRAAFDHGITHLGRFAAQYRTLFGELPSESARR